MQCTMCGREIKNPEANYCDYCGTAVGTAAYREVQVEQPKESVPKEDRVSTWAFLGVMCLPFVPFVGSIAYLVLLLYWGFAPGINDSRKSFARATLIYTVISVVLVMTVFGAMFAGMMTGVSEIL